MGIIPAITGKVELVLGEQRSSCSGTTLTRWCDSYFSSLFSKIEKLERRSKTAYTDIIEWFVESGFN
jgi:hypothetical protein